MAASPSGLYPVKPRSRVVGAIFLAKIAKFIKKFRSVLNLVPAVVVAIRA
jgi:hypothetical protein